MRWVAALVILVAFAVPAEALATVTSSLVGGQLVVASDGSDSISAACAGGLVKVNGADPGTGAAPASGDDPACGTAPQSSGRRSAVADELDDDLADELRHGGAQLVSDDLLELRGRGYGLC